MSEPVKGVIMDTAFFNDVKRYVLVMLGYPNVEVELCDEHLEQSIRDTIDEFRRAMAVDTLTFWKLQLIGQKAQYVLPLDCLVVRDVTIMQIADFENIFNNEIIINPLYLTNRNDVYQDILTFWVAEASYETWKRTYGLNPSWDIVNLRKEIRIQPTPGNGQIAIIKGSRQVTSADIDERALGTKMELFRRMTLARAKGILGRIRGKRVSGINTSQGVVQLDGDALRAESAQELMDARKELSSTGYPAGFYTG